MRLKLVFSALLVLFFMSCNNSGNDKTDKKKPKKILASSNGSINSLSVIIEDSLWKGDLGEGIRDKFAAPVTGLPQEEPVFSLSHIPPAAFSGFMRKSRIFLSIEFSKENKVYIVQDTFAKPQTGAVVRGESEEKILELISEYSRKMIQAFKKTEIRENQRRIAKSTENDKSLVEHFGLHMKFPTAYRYAVEEDGFVWLRKDIRHGSMEILVYQVPLNVIDRDTSVANSIIKMRDSVGKAHVPGPVDGSYMITEEAYSPFLYDTKIDGKPTYLTKGTWEVKGAYMAGPFVNYAIRDEKNDRYVVLEGFVFKPQTPTKRNNIFELQAIFRSARLDD